MNKDGTCFSLRLFCEPQKEKNLKDVSKRGKYVDNTDEKAFN